MRSKSLFYAIEPCVIGDTSPPLDGGPGDHDHADSETDTAIPDDDDDIASLASCSFESLQPSSLKPPGPLPPHIQSGLFLAGGGFFG